MDREDFVENIESAEGCLMDLISNNVVIVSKKEYNGKVKYCQESRVSYSFSKELSKFASLGSKTRKPFNQHLRSLITINDGEFIDVIPFCQILKLRLLKVLDLSSHKVRYLSTATLKPLNHLKYLAVSTVKFYFHPESHLPHLETLIVNSEWPPMLPASFWETEKLRHFEIWRAEFDFEEDKQGLFEGSSKLENLSILKNIIRFPIDRVDVLSRRCPNIQQLHIEFEYRGDNDSAGSFCLTLENLSQLQILHLSVELPLIVSGLQLPSNLKKLYLKEESFPLLETLVISDLVEIPLSFADIPTLKQIKLIKWYNKSLEASAVRIKEEVEAIDGCDRIVITTQRRITRFSEHRFNEALVTLVRGQSIDLCGRDGMCHLRLTEGMFTISKAKFYQNEPMAAFATSEEGFDLQISGFSPIF
ncbi:hypothetical protein MTR67_040752 [Solanum verrucosum]|uniref:Disease resistance R13L4/SHOC-2-like LRR domain-containing protein n=1 Tax=Solanum verrucosum TaxID=315347 RepID=A0AAF0UJU3_SOLVR|nr:hypothetical protein MTR67_040752 [Solanum verrucosum]